MGLSLWNCVVSTCLSTFMLFLCFRWAEDKFPPRWTAKFCLFWLFKHPMSLKWEQVLWSRKKLWNFCIVSKHAINRWKDWWTEQNECIACLRHSLRATLSWINAHQCKTLSTWGKMMDLWYFGHWSHAVWCTSSTAGNGLRWEIRSTFVLPFRRGTLLFQF